MVKARQNKTLQSRAWSQRQAEVQRCCKKDLRLRSTEVRMMEWRCLKKRFDSPVCCSAQTVWCKQRNSITTLEIMVQLQNGHKIKKKKKSKQLYFLLLLFCYGSLWVALPLVSPLQCLLPSSCLYSPPWLRSYTLSPPLRPLPWWLEPNRMRLWNIREKDLPTPELRVKPSDHF